MKIALRSHPGRVDPRLVRAALNVIMRSTTTATGLAVVTAAATAAAVGGSGPAWWTLLLVCSVGLVSFGIAFQVQEQYWRFQGEPPLFSGALPYLGHALDFGKDHAALLRRISAKCGKKDPAFTLYIAGKRMTFIRSPLDFSRVLREGQRSLQFRPVANEILKLGFGIHGVNFQGKTFEDWNKQNEPQWAMIRGKPLIKLMAKTQIELCRALEGMENSVDQKSGWQREEDLFKLVQKLMWTATGRSMFGDIFDTVSPDAEGNTGLDVAKGWFETFDKWFPLLAGGAPPKYLPGCAESMAGISDLFGKCKPDDLPGFVSEIIRFRQAYLHKHFEPHTVGGLQLAFVWATMANTIPTAFWALYFAIRDPTAMKKCRAEAEKTLGPWLRGYRQGSTNSSSREVAEKSALNIAEILNNMPCIQSVVLESLRLCIGSITLRESMLDFDLVLDKGRGSVRLRKGDRVVLAPTFTHYDKDIYPDPFAFIWDRFLVAPGENPGAAKLPSRGGSLSASLQIPRRTLLGRKLADTISLQPFGGGHTMCPGRHFALAEIKAFLALILVSFEFNFDNKLAAADGVIRTTAKDFPGFEQSRAGLGSLPPSSAVPCMWRRRAMTSSSR